MSEAYFLQEQSYLDMKELVFCTLQQCKDLALLVMVKIFTGRFYQKQVTVMF